MTFFSFYFCIKVVATCLFFILSRGHVRACTCTKFKAETQMTGEHTGVLLLDEKDIKWVIKPTVMRR